MRLLSSKPRKRDAKKTIPASRASSKRQRMPVRRALRAVIIIWAHPLEKYREISASSLYAENVCVP